MDGFGLNFSSSALSLDLGGISTETGPTISGPVGVLLHSGAFFVQLQRQQELFSLSS